MFQLATGKDGKSCARLQVSHNNAFNRVLGQSAPAASTLTGVSLVLRCCVQGMRVEVDFEGGKNASGIYVHKKLPEAMGNSVAAFAHAVLSGQSEPGVWYPEEKEALSVSRQSTCFLIRCCVVSWPAVCVSKHVGLTTGLCRGWQHRGRVRHSLPSAVLVLRGCHCPFRNALPCSTAWVVHHL